MGHRAAPPIYEKDRSIRSTRRPSSRSIRNFCKLFRKAIATSPICRHKIGYKVKRDMPGLDGPELDALYAKGKAWLKGKKL